MRDFLLFFLLKLSSVLTFHVTMVKRVYVFGLLPYLFIRLIFGFAFFLVHFIIEFFVSCVFHFLI